MTTDAKPLPLSAEELAAYIETHTTLGTGSNSYFTGRLLATIAQQAEQIAELRAKLAEFHRPPMLTRW